METTKVLSNVFGYRLEESSLRKDVMLSMCCQPRSQNDEANETLFWLLKGVSDQQNLVLTGDIHYLDICWQNNTVVHKSFLRFLKCIEDCFLLQMLDMLARRSTLLHLLLAKQDSLLDYISTNGSFG